MNEWMFFKTSAQISKQKGGKLYRISTTFTFWNRIISSYLIGKQLDKSKLHSVRTTIFIETFNTLFLGRNKKVSCKQPLESLYYSFKYSVTLNQTTKHIIKTSYTIMNTVQVKKNLHINRNLTDQRLCKKSLLDSSNRWVNVMTLLKWCVNDISPAT